MRRLIGLLFLLGLLNYSVFGAEEVRSLYIVGGEDSGSPACFKIVNGEINASFKLDFSYQFREFASAAGLFITNKDMPEEVFLNMTGFFRDDQVMATGTAYFFLRIEIEPELWETRKIECSVSWTGREVDAMYNQYFEINQTLAGNLPFFNYQDADKKILDMRFCEMTRLLRPRIIKKITEDDFKAFSGKYIVCGDKNINEDLKGKLLDLDLRFAKVDDAVTATDFDQAATLLESCMAVFKDYKKSWGCGIKLIRYPAEGISEKISRLELYESRLKEQLKMAVNNNDKTLKLIEDSKNKFAASVVKTMLTSFVSWQGTIPTTPEDAPGKFSLTTGIFDLPRGLLDWQSSAIKDASVLNDQKNTLRHLELYEKFWAELRDKCVAELKKINEEKQESHLVRLKSVFTEISKF